MYIFMYAWVCVCVYVQIYIKIQAFEHVLYNASLQLAIAEYTLCIQVHSPFLSFWCCFSWKRTEQMFHDASLCLIWHYLHSGAEYFCATVHTLNKHIHILIIMFQFWKKYCFQVCVCVCYLNRRITKLCYNAWISCKLK